MTKPAKSKTKVSYVCTACGATSPRWLGKCAECGAWNTLEEQLVRPRAHAPAAGREGPRGPSKSVPLGEVESGDARRLPTGIGELDRALGGGPVVGGVVLLGGDPGIGKSTLLMQALAALADQGRGTLYVTGEESASQVAMRAERLGVPGVRDVRILATTDLDDVKATLHADRPDVAVIDSIQTLRWAELEVSTGSATHLRAITEQLVEWAKRDGVSLFLIGHVTKEGAIAGPKVLEHLVDTVLSFEGDRSHAFRLVRATKNRFGPAHEVGVFEMVREGLREVPEPSALFLAERPARASGSVVVPTAEGTRPLLVEVQALVAPAMYGGARRVASGLDANRLAILLAVLDRKAGVHILDQDVFASVAGGAKVDERALDLALAAAVVSSFRGVPVPPDLAIFGEVGLAGEVRAVPRPAPRVAEARKLGFKRILLPALSFEMLSPKEREGAQLFPVRSLEEALELALGR
ncbi:MAG: DNA repair protein RadA [Polyangiales bacterium]